MSFVTVATIKIDWIQDGESFTETQNINCQPCENHYTFHNNVVGEFNISIPNFDMAIDVVEKVMLEQGRDFCIKNRLPDLSPSFSVDYLIAENAALKNRLRELENKNA